MGDNVVVPGRGAILVTDEIDGIHWPITKLAFGVADSATLVSTGNPLPVSPVSMPLPTGAATQTTLAACLTQLQALVSEDAGLATATGQASALTVLQTLATALSGTLAVDGSGHTQPISAASLPLPTGAATQTTLAAVLTALQATLTVSASSLPLPTGAATDAKVEAVRALLAGTLAVSAAALPLPAGAATQATLASVLSALQGTLVTAPAANQDPIFDHANGTKSSVTASATIITPPTGCLYLRLSTDVDIYVNTAGNTAVDDGTSIRIVANSPEVIPVVAGTAVKALSSAGTATVRCTPMKVR